MIIHFFLKLNRIVSNDYKLNGTIPESIGNLINLEKL